MDTGKLKRFATEARINLIDGVRRKLRSLGFDEEGNLIDREPLLLQGATLWKEEEYPEAFYHQWKALQEKIQKHSVQEVVEEAAYTWFNRLVAIRILTKNKLCEPILMTEGNASGYPLLLEVARMGRVPRMDVQQQHRFDKLMDNDTLVYDQFALLLTLWCHDNPIINACFGSTHDFVELLLPENILRPDGFLTKLNTTDFISDEDFQSAELIGWLYQFYISDRKDEVMKKQKYAADEIPAATQIFTPNWIVKYMVENTILPQVDAPDDILEKAKYLVDNPDAAPSEKIELEDMKVADFACGSGHILNECFDLLFDLYREEAYSRREAVEAIFTKNLLGIDIDLRAKQLATFALLLKACQKDASFADATCLPRVLTVPEMPQLVQDPKGFLPHFFLGSLTKDATDELCVAWEDLRHADVLGSIIKFRISGSTRRQIKEAVEHWRKEDFIPQGIQDGLPVMGFILALTDSYNAIVMNPPYMNPNKDVYLKAYATKQYPTSKGDLYSIFMDIACRLVNSGGRFGMITLPSWMLLGTFADFRNKLITSSQIESLLHLGRGIFGSDMGSVSFVISCKSPSSAGYYRRLFNKHVEVRTVSKIQKLFLDSTYGVFITNQKKFIEIPGTPIAYWVSDNMRNMFKGDIFKKFFRARHGLLTGHDEDMLRNWHEVNAKLISFHSNSMSDFHNSGLMYVPVFKGGPFKKWYGSMETIAKFDEKTLDYMQRYPNFVLKSKEKYFQEGLNWTLELHRGNLSVRYLPKGCLFSNRGPALFSYCDTSIPSLLGFLISPVAGYFLGILGSALSISAGTFENIPIIKRELWNKEIPLECIAISKDDFDAHETSWDFKENELINLSKQGLGIHTSWIGSPNNVVARGGYLELLINEYEVKWEELFKRLHSNEEELNRKFIEIYSLQDELTPDVSLDEITILQQGEISIGKEDTITDEGSHILITEDQPPIIVNVPEEKIIWHRDVIIKQLISYIVGCYMGRYRLDKPGLAIAHPNPSAEELADYTFNITGEETFTIDSDAIIPVLPTDAPFYDNLYNYVSEFIRKVWGADSHTENMNFIDSCLGKPLNDYLMRDFWKDHKKMYQNRPIYWEFASPKGAFKAIVYAHRMDRFTVEVLRSKYLLPYRNFIEQKIANLEARYTDLTTAERRELDTLRKKTLPELTEYHDRVEQVAAETAARETVFDLDDGIPHNHSLFGSIVTKLK